MNHALRPTTVQMVSLSDGTSTQSSAFGANIEYIRIASTADVHILFGSNPTATANSIYLPADEVELFKVSPGEKVAIIGANGNKISITELSE